MNKQCQMCNKTKPVNKFYKSKQTKDGYFSYCAPCKIECNRQSTKHRMSVDRDRHLRMRKNNHLKTMYGITIEEYDKMLEEQNGVCAICGEPERQNYRRLAVDHNHTTNKIRALLCYGCNRGIGSFRENPDSLVKAAEYLRNWY